MRRIVLLWMLLCGLLLPRPGHACSCGAGLLSDSTVRAAKRIYVVQLVGAQWRPEGNDQVINGHVEARIRVVKRLVESRELASRRVDSGPARVQAWYTVGRCCGVKLDVGHYYAVFDVEGADPLRLSEGNLLPLGAAFDPGGYDFANLQRVVHQGVRLESAFGEIPSGRLLQAPAPPPPPCPPGKKR
jgi:hypothetical protein